MAKQETGHQRRQRLIKAGLCTNCGKRKPAKKADGTLGRECQHCKDYFATWSQQHAKAATPTTKGKPGKRPTAVASPPLTLKANSLTTKEFVESISRSVAAAAFADARFTPAPMTRTEMFDKVRVGVEEGVKKSGIGFHAKGGRA